METVYDHEHSTCVLYRTPRGAWNINGQKMFDESRWENRSRVSDSPRRRSGFNAGSCTSNAFATANVKASACPVTPPPEVSAKTLYLSSLCETFKAQTALSRSCTRPKNPTRDFPLTKTSPSPSTTHAVADDVFRRPTPFARPSSSMIPG